MPDDQLYNQIKYLEKKLTQTLSDLDKSNEENEKYIQVINDLKNEIQILRSSNNPNIQNADILNSINSNLNSLSTKISNIKIDNKSLPDNYLDIITNELRIYKSKLINRVLKHIWFGYILFLIIWVLK